MTATTPRPRKQEQEPASAEVTEVAPGVLRLQLPIQFPGLRHVNTYALEDERGVALVDPGMPGPQSWRSLKERLQTAGVPLRRVHTVIVTHSHPDHFGGAAQLRNETGAEVVAHRSFRTWFDPDEDEGLDDEPTSSTAEPAPVRKKPWDRTTPWGGRHPQPPLKMRALYRVRGLLRRRFGTPSPSRRLEDADVIRLARRDWVAMRTPGHTSDHLCLYDPAEGVLLSGDHVLPTITPHIGGMDEADSLQRFFDSLERVGELENVRQVLPAHGHPFSDITGRTKDIRRHHEERLATLRAASIGLGRPATVEELSRHLFQPRAWGPMADSETFAHLEHLRLIGEAERVDAEAGSTELRYLVTG